MKKKYQKKPPYVPDLSPRLPIIIPDSPTALKPVTPVRKRSKRKKYILFHVLYSVILIPYPLSSAAQVMFEKTYGTPNNEYGRQAIVTANDNYQMIGYMSKNASNKDIYFLKVDTCGREKLSRTYGGLQDDIATAIIETNSGNFAIAGNTRSFGAPGNNAYFMKASGPVFATTLGRAIGDTLDDNAESLQQTSDLGYIVAGSTKSKGAGNYDMMLQKFNGTGTPTWSRTYGGFQDDQGYAVRQISGGYVIAGSTKSFGAGNNDVYLIRTNASGNVIWSRTYGNVASDIGYDIRQTLDGGFILVGKTRNSNPSGNSLDDILLIKISYAGNLQWSKAYGGLQDETGESIQQLTDSSYVIAGYTKSFGNGNWDAYLFKVNKSGSVIWARTFGGTGEDKAFSLERTNDNGFLLCGHSNSFGAGGFDVYLMKTNSFGKTGCNDSSGINMYSRNDSIKNGGSIDSSLKVLNGALVDTLITIDSVVCSNCFPPQRSMEEDELGEDYSLSIFPNPANDLLLLTAANNGEVTSDITIYNEFGSVMYEEENVEISAYENSFRIDIHLWMPGIYFIKFSGAKIHECRKLLIIR
jgi:hypothetical protein